MARIRTIKPEFWDDEKVGTLSFMERLLFIGMWTFADDEGIIKANASYLKSHIFPYDESLKTEAIEKSLQRFESLNMVYRYSINSQAYAWIVKFRVYQRIDKPQKSTNPSPSTQNGKYASAVHSRDGYVCHLCGSECSPFQIIGKETDPRVASLDHVIPQSKGGHNYPSNLRTACISCNKSRGNKDLEEFLKDIGRFQEYSENNPGTFNDGMERNGKERKGREGKGEYTEPFLVFYEKYPKKEGKAEAQKAWTKLNPQNGLQEKILTAIQNQSNYKQMLRDSDQFCPEWPNPATWLNNRRWEDEIPKETGDRPWYDKSSTQ